MSHLDQDMGILSKSLGQGGAGVYEPAKYEYAMNPAPGLRGGRKSRVKKSKKSKSRKVRRTSKKGVLGKAKSALRKMFRM
jgi:hypothetical protein